MIKTYERYFSHCLHDPKSIQIKKLISYLGLLFSQHKNQIKTVLWNAKHFPISNPVVHFAWGGALGSRWNEKPDWKDCARFLEFWAMSQDWNAFCSELRGLDIWNHSFTSWEAWELLNGKMSTWRKLKVSNPEFDLRKEIDSWVTTVGETIATMDLGKHYLVHKLQRSPN